MAATPSSPSFSSSPRAFLTYFSIIAAIFFPVPAWTAAWTQPEGKTELIHNVFYYTTDESFDRAGNTIPQERFSKLEYNAYGEYGLREDVTVGASISTQYLRQAAVVGEDDSNLGIADVELFIRQRVWQNDAWVVSIQPLVKIAGPYDDRDTPQLGNGQMDMELRGLVGHTFSVAERYHFANLEVGYRKRFENPTDEVRVDGTLGMRFTEDWMVLAQTFNTLSIDSVAASPVLVTNSTDFDLHKLQLSVVHTIDDTWSVQLGGFQHVSGENTGAGGGAVFSVWMTF